MITGRIHRYLFKRPQQNLSVTGPHDFFTIYLLLCSFLHGFYHNSFTGLKFFFTDVLFVHYGIAEGHGMLKAMQVGLQVFCVSRWEWSDTRLYETVALVCLRTRNSMKIYTTWLKYPSNKSHIYFIALLLESQTCEYSHPVTSRCNLYN